MLIFIKYLQIKMVFNNMIDLNKYIEKLFEKNIDIINKLKKSKKK